MAASSFPSSSQDREGSGTRGFLLILVAAIVGALLLSRLLFNPDSRHGGTEAVAGLDLVDPPRPVGSDWQLESLANGERVSLESLRGKVVFLNVWATWCGPCVREMPSIEALWEKFASDPAVAFVLVASDDDREDVKRFAEARKPGLPIYLPTEPAPRALRSSAIPATFVLDKDHAIRLKTIGSANWDSEPVAKLLRDLARGTEPGLEADQAAGAAGATVEPKPL